MHNLQLTEDQDMIVDTVRKFVADAVAPAVLELDEHRTFMRGQFDGLAELGLFGLTVAEDHGGAGMGFVPFIGALEAIGAQSGSLARLWIGQAQCALALEVASAEQLADVAAGTVLASFVDVGNGIVLANGRLHGTAGMCVAGGEAQTFVVAARENGSPVLVLVDAAQVAREPLRSLGLNSAACARVSFDTSAITVLATGDVATQAITRADLVAWLGVAAAAVGGGFGSIVAGRKHASERIAFGKPLLAQEAVQQKLVEASRQVEAARHLAFHAARLADLGQDATEPALQARIAAVEAMVSAADESIQIHGGFGYTVEYHVERHYRDGKTLEVLDGGNASMRNRLAALQMV